MAAAARSRLWNSSGVTEADADTPAVPPFFSTSLLMPGIPLAWNMRKQFGLERVVGGGGSGAPRGWWRWVQWGAARRLNYLSPPVSLLFFSPPSNCVFPSAEMGSNSVFFLTRSHHWAPLKLAAAASELKKKDRRKKEGKKRQGGGGGGGGSRPAVVGSSSSRSRRMDGRASERGYNISSLCLTHTRTLGSAALMAV